jgi:hypothetical protein
MRCYIRLAPVDRMASARRESPSNGPHQSISTENHTFIASPSVER